MSLKDPQRFFLLSVCIIIQFCCLVEEATCQSHARLSIDHVPLVVKDLEQAKRDFSSLGFSVKEGRLHRNSINNAHLKFKDGSSLELITASESKDRLSQFYIDFLAKGEGPAFISLEVASLDLLQDLLTEYNLTRTEGSYYVWFTFPEDHPLSYLFFIHYKQSAIDLPEHLSHSNTALGIATLILRKDNFSEEIRLFSKMGYDVEGSNENFSTQYVNLHQATLVLEMDKNATGVRPIRSLTLRAQNLEKVRKNIPEGTPFVENDSGSIAIPATVCHGIAISFSTN